MIEGLWTIKFASNLQYQSAGVIVFETGKIFGGDNQYYYIGDYEIANGFLKAKAKITSHVTNPLSIFGNENSFELIINSLFNPQGNTFLAFGHKALDVNAKIGIQLIKQCDLP